VLEVIFIKPDCIFIVPLSNNIVFRYHLHHVDTSNSALTETSEELLLYQKHIIKDVAVVLVLQNLVADMWTLQRSMQEVRESPSIFAYCSVHTQRAQSRHPHDHQTCRRRRFCQKSSSTMLNDGNSILLIICD
jgi:hypothetical protein